MTSKDDRRKLRKLVERSINTAIVIAAIVCAAAWIHYWTRTPPAALQPSNRPQYMAGDTLGDVPEIVALKAEPTLLLFLDSGCHICTESLGVYRRVIEYNRRNGSHVRIVAASRESQSSFQRYLADHRLTPDNIITLDDNSPFRLTRTPTLVMLDRTRRVTNVWLGWLTERREAEVIAAVAAEDTYSLTGP